MNVSSGSISTAFSACCTARSCFSILRIEHRQRQVRQHVLVVLLEQLLELGDRLVVLAVALQLLVLFVQLIDGRHGKTPGGWQAAEWRGDSIRRYHSSPTVS